MPRPFDHCIFVGTELWEHLVGEMAEPAEGGASRRRPRSVGFGTPEFAAVVAGGAFEIIDHLPVEVVELGGLRVGPRVGVALRRRLAVLVVEVPATADGFAVVVDQVAEPGPLPAIEVRHLERLAPVGPCRELVVVAEELVGAHDRDIEVAQQLETVPARRFGCSDLLGVVLRDVLAKPLAQGIAVAVVDVEARVGQFDHEPPHRRDHEMGALAMPPLGGEFAERLDDQDAMRVRLGIGERTDPAIQLIAEHPDRLHPTILVAQQVRRQPCDDSVEDSGQ